MIICSLQYIFFLENLQYVVCNSGVVVTLNHRCWICYFVIGDYYNFFCKSKILLTDSIWVIFGYTCHVSLISYNVKNVKKQKIIVRKQKVTCNIIVDEYYPLSNNTILTKKIFLLELDVLLVGWRVYLNPPIYLFYLTHQLHTIPK